MISKAFKNSQDHLLAELGRLDFLLQALVAQEQRAYSVDPNFRGLYISEQDVNNDLYYPTIHPRWAKRSLISDDLAQQLQQLEHDIRQRVEVSGKQGVELKLDQLCRKYALSPFEKDVVLLALAPELDVRYGRIYAFLHDDITRKRPSVELAFSLFCNDFNDKYQARELLSPSAKLTKSGLIHVLEEDEHSHSSMLLKHIVLDERIVEYLLEQTPAAVESFAIISYPLHTFDQLIFNGPTSDTLHKIAAERNQDAVYYLQGESGVGKTCAVEAICREWGSPMLQADCRKWVELPREEITVILRKLGRESILQDAVICLQHFDAFFLHETGQLKQISDFIIHTGQVLFLTGVKPWEPPVTINKKFHSLSISKPDFSQRVQLWQAVLAGNDHNRVDLQALASTFRLTGSEIQNAAVSALRVLEDGKPLITDHLFTACRDNANHRLENLAQKIIPRYHMSDIVLPKEQQDQLDEIQIRVRQTARVYDLWGFERKLALGKGTTILFSGASGTGKTMAADIIANELSLELFKIDLSFIVSKYIGETEKNLSAVFNEASSSNAILFFDEADALFSKRTQVKDAHDRYANIETGFLLQKMEGYEGVVILATNLKSNMDSAMNRRIACSVLFPLPEENERFQIWRKIWPAETPRAPDLDFKFMAKQFRLTGGSIKNIAMSSAFLAADEDTAVAMKHIIQATKREIQKLGRNCGASEFGQYYSLLAA